MLDLHSCHRALDSFAQRFFDEELPEGACREAFAAFDRGAYDEATLSLGRSAWQLRVLDEYRSQLAFTELLADLSRLGAAFDAISTCVRVVRDEARHVELCRRLVVALGGDDAMPGDPQLANPDPSSPAMQRVMHTVLGSLCVGETFSVRMLAAVRQNTVDPLAREVMTVLTKDESVHSRFGWTMLEVVAPHLSDDERRAADEALPHYLKMAERAVVPADAHLHEDHHPLVAGPESPFGCLPPRARRELFYACLEEDVLPSLDERGFDGAAAWRRAQAL